MSNGAEELEALEALEARGPEADEAARSLAAGAVVRGRLTLEQAAQMSTFTVAELRQLTDSQTGETASKILVSVVVPALNEEENLDDLWSRLRPVLDAVGDGEMIVVDDGSTDATWSEIVRLGAADRRVRGVRLSRNFGHQAALTAGMAHARGQTVCFLDADLQDPPGAPRAVPGRVACRQSGGLRRSTHAQGGLGQAHCLSVLLPALSTVREHRCPAR